MAQDKSYERHKRYIESMADYDGTEFLFEKKYRLTLRLGVVEPNEDFPLGFYYEFNLFAPDAQGNSTTRILAAGNSHAASDAKHPFDHWHSPMMNASGKVPIGVNKGAAVKVTSMETHIGKFFHESQQLLIAMGVNPEVLNMTHRSAKPQMDMGLGL